MNGSGQIPWRTYHVPKCSSSPGVNDTPWLAPLSRSSTCMKSENPQKTSSQGTLRTKLEPAASRVFEIANVGSNRRSPPKPVGSCALAIPAKITAVVLVPSELPTNSVTCEQRTGGPLLMRAGTPSVPGQPEP